MGMGLGYQYCCHGYKIATMQNMQNTQSNPCFYVFNPSSGRIFKLSTLRNLEISLCFPVLIPACKIMYQKLGIIYVKHCHMWKKCVIQKILLKSEGTLQLLLSPLIHQLWGKHKINSKKTIVVSLFSHPPAFPSNHMPTPCGDSSRHVTQMYFVMHCGIGVESESCKVLCFVLYCRGV